MADAAAVQVTVIYSPAPRQVREWQVSVPAGATVLQALQASGLATEFPGVDASSSVVGIWGRDAALAQPVRHNDRVEVYRPLRVDPKVARRERFRKQGVRAAGLFARKR
jgi:putative ubiquitin-RnfH superfamily antitoxin RatB of RatAB toxin-antitoxin module